MRGWTTIEGLSSLSLDDVWDANDVLDAVVAAEQPKGKGKR